MRSQVLHGSEASKQDQQPPFAILRSYRKCRELFNSRRRTSDNLRYIDDTTLMAESEEELKRLLIKVKEESEKAGLKLNIQTMKIMPSSPITQWQIDGKTMGTVTDFIFLGSKITVDVDCSHEVKRCLLLGKKVMANLDRDITLPQRSV